MKAEPCFFVTSRLVVNLARMLRAEVEEVLVGNPEEQMVPTAKVRIFFDAVNGEGVQAYVDLYGDDVGEFMLACGAFSKRDVKAGGL